VLGQADELIGPQHAELRMFPAHQRLHPTHLAVGKAHLGLAEEPQFVAVDGPVQIADQRQPPRALLIPPTGVQCLPVAMLARLVHSHIGAPDEGIRLSAVTGKHRNANAATGIEHDLADRHRIEHLGQDPLRHSGCGTGIAVGQQNGKLRLAHTRDVRRIDHGTPDTGGNLAQHRIALVIAQGFVYLLEVIYSEHQQCKWAMARPGPPDLIVEPHPQAPSVGQAGQWVLFSHPFDRRLGLAATLARAQGFDSEGQIAGEFAEQVGFGRIEGVRFGSRDGQIADDLSPHM